MKPIGCLCCGEEMELHVTKAKAKPYLSCDACGVQIFIRAKRGISLFENRFGSDWHATAPVAGSAPPAADSKAGAGHDRPEGGRDAGGIW